MALARSGAAPSGARTLRLVYHARNLRQHRRLAQRLRAANYRPVVVERTRQQGPHRPQETAVAEA